MTRCCSSPDRSGNTSTFMMLSARITGSISRPVAEPSSTARNSLQRCPVSSRNIGLSGTAGWIRSELLLIYPPTHFLQGSRRKPAGLADQCVSEERRTPLPTRIADTDVNRSRSAELWPGAFHEMSSSCAGRGYRRECNRPRMRNNQGCGSTAGRNLPRTHTWLPSYPCTWNHARLASRTFTLLV